MSANHSSARSVTLHRGFPRARSVIAGLILGLASVTVTATTTTFTDDFNRPDGVVGNGWLPWTGGPSGDLVIQDGALTAPDPFMFSGIYRPVDYSAPVTISGTFTQTSGYLGPSRYESGFLLGTTGAMASGYEVLFQRSESISNNSSVSLYMNGGLLTGSALLVSKLNSPFQFESSITPTVTYSSSEGRIFGSVTGSGNTFNFDFGAVPNIAIGSNIGIQLESGAADGGWSNATFIRPTFDNVSITYAENPPPPPPPPPPLPPGAPVPDDPFTRPGTTSLTQSTDGAVVIDQSKPTIVLTHGWQPTGTYNPAETPLSELLDAVQAKLCTSGSCSANILTYQWPQAYTSGIVLPINFAAPHLPRIFAQDAGSQLATQLSTLLGSDYAENVHLVGHSFGTLVNSHAANELSGFFDQKAYGVDQLTFLDPPLFDVATGIGNVVSKGAYYGLLPPGTVEYVDNFYGTTRPIAFGDKLPGAAPDNTGELSSGGEQVPFLNHSQIQSVFYTQRVQDQNGTWISAVIEDRYGNRPAPMVWPGGVGVQQVLAEIPGVIADIATAGWQSIVNTAEQTKEFLFDVGGQVRRVVVDSTNAVIEASKEITVIAINVAGDTATAILDAGAGAVSAASNKVRSWFRLKESSPVMVGQKIEVPTGAEVLSFDFDVIAAGDGDWLTVYFDDKLLWSYLIADVTGDLTRAIIPISELGGESGMLYVTLNSFGNANADILIGEMALTAFRSTSVPEPPPITLMLIALGGVYATALKRRR